MLKKIITVASLFIALSAKAESLKTDKCPVMGPSPGSIAYYYSLGYYNAAAYLSKGLKDDREWALKTVCAVNEIEERHSLSDNECLAIRLGTAMAYGDKAQAISCYAELLRKAGK